MIDCEDSISHTQARVNVASLAGIEFKRISPAIGVEISGIDLRQPLSDPQAQELRQALVALSGAPGGGDKSVFMAGLVGQIQADLNALREEFNLPDVSNAADAQLAAEVAQWAE